MYNCPLAVQRIAVFPRTFIKFLIIFPTKGFPQNTLPRVWKKNYSRTEGGGQVFYTDGFPPKNNINDKTYGFQEIRLFYCMRQYLVLSREYPMKLFYTNTTPHTGTAEVIHPMQNSSYLF